jgi:hypothetical protein
MDLGCKLSHKDRTMVDSVFEPIHEKDRHLFRTEPIRSQDCSDVARVVAVLLTHFVEAGEWTYKPHKGSVTIFRIGDDDGRWPYMTVFVDIGATLAVKCGLALTGNPIVVGVELTQLSPFVRHSVREQLTKMFSNYVDPRLLDKSKWALKPKAVHDYDLVFLERGSCDYEVEPDRLESIRANIQRVIDQSA